jgi:uncharacterized NAD(P)/FAD-binding protein YdhS
VDFTPLFVSFEGYRVSKKGEGQMRRITIIGGGATGTLLAVNLIRHAGDKPLEINVVEKNERFGVGVAYSTNRDFHLLNVPAGKMGAFPDDVEHFHKWLGENGHSYEASAFVPRRIYGEYLRKVFAEARKWKSDNTEVSVHNEEAIDIVFKDGEAEVWLNSGEKLISDKVVLAFGNFLPPPPRSENQDFLSSPNYFPNPWSEKIDENIRKRDDVFIIGTGLTMVDTVMAFYNAKHKGKIFAASTHGLLPSVHKLGFTYPSFEDEVDELTNVSRMVKAVRAHIKKAESDSSDWRAVIDSLRPFTQKTWLRLSHDEKRRFMRHLKHFWNTSRHRIPAECAEILYRMQWTGQLHIKKGRAKNFRIRRDGKFEIALGDEKIAVNKIINCTGSESDFAKVEVPLVKSLLLKGAIKTDALSLGLEAATNGKISDNLYTIGTSLKGIMWESTAMPELRAQAKNLALHFLNQ